MVVQQQQQQQQLPARWSVHLSLPKSILDPKFP